MHDVEVCKMETYTNKTLEELRVDLVWFLPEESLYVLVRYLIGKFYKLRDMEESLGEVLTLRMQDRKAVTAAIKKIQDIQKRTDMRGWHKVGTMKPKFMYNRQYNTLSSPHRFHHRTLVDVASTARKHALISLPPLDFQPTES